MCTPLPLATAGARSNLPEGVVTLARGKLGAGAGGTDAVELREAEKESGATTPWGGSLGPQPPPLSCRVSRVEPRARRRKHFFAPRRPRRRRQGGRWRLRGPADAVGLPPRALASRPLHGDTERGRRIASGSRLTIGRGTSKRSCSDQPRPAHILRAQHPNHPQVVLALAFYNFA